MASQTLGPGAAPFRAWRIREIPDAWRHECSAQKRQAAISLDTTVANIRQALLIELPDDPWTWAYAAWVQELEVSAEDPHIEVAVVARENFRMPASADEQRRETAETLTVLLQKGRPKPLWARTWATVESFTAKPDSSSSGPGDSRRRSADKA